MKKTTMDTRRQMLARSARLAAMLAAAGLLPAAARAAYDTQAFEARTMAGLTKALGTSAPVESQDVTVTGPDIAEDGAVVPIGAATTLPGVRRVLILVEQNPAILSAAFDVTDAVEPNFSMRVKMAQSSRVYAVAVTGEGGLLYAQKDIQVTLGGCGG